MFLKGKKLLRRVRLSDYTEELEITLCRDMSFKRSSAGSVSRGGSINSDSIGTWSVVSDEDVLLVLKAQSGNVYKFVLEEDTSDAKLKLNSKSYFVQSALLVYPEMKLFALWPAREKLAPLKTLLTGIHGQTKLSKSLPVRTNLCF